jgi:hypothetical protein
MAASRLERFGFPLIRSVLTCALALFTAGLLAATGKSSATFRGVNGLIAFTFVRASGAYELVDARRYRPLDTRRPPPERAAHRAHHERSAPRHDGVDAFTRTRHLPLQIEPRAALPARPVHRSGERIGVPAAAIIERAG